MFLGHKHFPKECVVRRLFFDHYVYAVLGFHFFRVTDPAHWGSLGTALLTLFQMLTLEGWVEIQAAVLDAHPFAWIYFSSFVLLAVFVVVNLFIAVVINNLESVKHEQQIDTDRASAHRGLFETIETVRVSLEELEERLRAMPSGKDIDPVSASGRADT